MKVLTKCVAASSLLAACGDAEELPLGPSSIDFLEAEEIRLTDQLEEYIDVGAVGIPPSSDLDYTGVMYVAGGGATMPADAWGVLGEMTATYTLSTETLSGTADGFYLDELTPPSIGAAGEAVDGSVTFSGSGVSGGQISSVSITGTINGEALTGSGSADFSGPTGEMFAVEASTATLGGRTDSYVAAYGE